jgi:sugar phosphate isomerase/epimerase
MHLRIGRFLVEGFPAKSEHSSARRSHAHLVPEGVAGFVDAIDMSRVEEVRLADCFRNGHEIHLKPGAGDLDFADMFRRVEGKGFTGHYMNAFGSLDDMLAARDDLARQAEAAG